MKDFSLSSDIKPDSALKDHYKILLVDDEADILHILKRRLEIKGFEVDAMILQKKHLTLSNQMYVTLQFWISGCLIKRFSIIQGNEEV
jgi:PleD family two-component response regulator